MIGLGASPIFGIGLNIEIGKSIYAIEINSLRAAETGWSIGEMEEPLNWNSIPQCRLCGRFGPHKIDIFGNNAYHLIEKIFKCTGIRVNTSAFR